MQRRTLLQAGAALGLVAARVCAATGRLPGEGYRYAAMVVGWLIQLPFGAVHIGELGFPAWLAVGLALAAGADPSEETRRPGAPEGHLLG